MPSGQRPDFDVFVSQKTNGNKTFYTKIGAAWNVSRDGISIKLVALPISGELILFPHRQSDRE